MVYQPEQCMGLPSSSSIVPKMAPQFFRSVRNFVLDTRQVPADVQVTGIHWQVSQATSLINLRVEMSRQNGTVHRGFVIHASYAHLN